MTTQWYLDAEFDDDGHTIDLISIALVSHSNEYFAVAYDGFNPDKCSQWVRDNVLPKLPSRYGESWRSRSQIALEIEQLLSGDKPEIWGYFSSFDWVVFCQLFGRMVDLPKNFPKHCLDLRQEMKRIGVNREDLPDIVRTPTIKHDALADARWMKNLHQYLRNLPASSSQAIKLPIPVPQTQERYRIDTNS